MRMLVKGFCEIYQDTRKQWHEFYLNRDYLNHCVCKHTTVNNLQSEFIYLSDEYLTEARVN